MDIAHILPPEFALCRVKLRAKKQVLELIAKQVHEADHRVPYQDILEALSKRERLGSTVIGHGVAIPHARIAQLAKPLCLIITLAEPLSFDPEDSALVNIVFGLLVPKEATEQHLDILKSLAEKLSQPAYRNALAQAHNNETLYHATIQEDPPNPST